MFPKRDIRGETFLKVVPQSYRGVGANFTGASNRERSLPTRVEFHRISTQLPREKERASERASERERERERWGRGGREGGASLVAISITRIAVGVLHAGIIITWLNKGTGVQVGAL